MAHLQTVQRARPAVPACMETTRIDKLPAINFVKDYLDDVSLVLNVLKHQQRLGDCFMHAVAMHMFMAQLRQHLCSESRLFVR
jgi:hypothetical protein